MHRFRKILVGVDLSHGDRLAAPELNPPTEEAVRRAIWLGAQLQSPITFCAILDISAHAEELLQAHRNGSACDVERTALQILDGLIQRAAAEGAQATARLAFGQPWREIIRQVVDAEHDLVIVGTRSRGPAARLLFGSTGLKLLRYCPCPVWVTKPDPNWDDLNILVASDLSETSLSALQMAVGGAQLANAKIHLLHAVELNRELSVLRSGVPDEQVEEYRRKKLEEAERAIHEQLAQTDYRTTPFGVKVHVVEGQADISILQAIEEFGIDLLMMGTAARSGIPGLILGNTAERLIAQVPCSVLAVKPHGFTCPISID